MKDNNTKDWNADIYLRFERERTQPAIDLLNRVTLNDSENLRIIDIGCGPANSTKLLRERFKRAKILGIDSSQNMLQKARQNCPKEQYNIDFELCDANSNLANIREKFDLLFANASLQWLDNHKQKLEQMFALLKDKGILAVQIPNNHIKSIPHQILRVLSCRDKYKARLENIRALNVLSEESYFDILSSLTGEFEIWESVYFHRLHSYDDFLQWYRATGLKPYLEPLSKEEAMEFESEFLAEIKRHYTFQANGEIIFKFPRLFFMARKG